MHFFIFLRARLFHTKLTMLVRVGVLDQIMEQQNTGSASSMGQTTSNGEPGSWVSVEMADSGLLRLAVRSGSHGSGLFTSTELRPYGTKILQNCNKMPLRAPSGECIMLLAPIRLLTNRFRVIRKGNRHRHMKVYFGLFMFNLRKISGET